jgi:arabinofuranosyltransferase
VYDLTLRYFGGLREQAGWIAGALVLLLVGAINLFRSLSPGVARRVYIALTVALALGACAWALHLGWVGDDAFITFRYVRNFVQGQGLVYNSGERVEGYTDFLWVILLAPFAALGADLPLASIFLTLTCLCGTLGMTAYLVRRVSPEPARLGFSLAAVVLGLNYIIASYGTSGLETMLGALLVLLAVERAERRAALTAGLYAILATMTHPDHAIFYVALGLTFLLSPDRWRLSVRFALPFVLLYLPYFAWRWSYYGDFFPNTYYAKSADALYFRQGFRYLLISGFSTGLFVALPAAIFGMIRFRRTMLARFTAIATPLYLTYVAKIGGDFMLGRLLVPLLPPVFIMAELGIRALGTSRRRWVNALGVAALGLFCTAAVPVRLIKPGEKYRYLADERTFYPIGKYRPFSLDVIYWQWGEAFNEVFARLTRKPNLAMGSLGIIGYQTSLRIIDNYGLVHRGVAHTKIRTRGRPGHEKLIGPGMLVQTDADLSDIPVYPAEYEPYGSVNVAGAIFSAVRYDVPLFDELSRAGVRAPGVTRFIRDYRPPRGKDAEVRLDCDLWYMEQIYFSHNSDPARRDAIVKRVVKARPEWRGLEDFILSQPPPGGPVWLAASRIGFDELPPTAVLKGSAFTHNPVLRESAGQGSAANNVGPFINTFQELDADAATGELLLPEFTIEGDAITLRVGGGKYPGSVGVELLVDGERRFGATGCNSEMLGRRLWPTAELRGKRAQLHLIDHSPGGWGHLVVDELVQWRRIGEKTEAPAAQVVDPTFQR